MLWRFKQIFNNTLRVKVEWQFVWSIWDVKFYKKFTTLGNFYLTCTCVACFAYYSKDALLVNSKSSVNLPQRWQLLASVVVLTSSRTQSKSYNIKGINIIGEVLDEMNILVPKDLLRLRKHFACDTYRWNYIEWISHFCGHTLHKKLEKFKVKNRRKT